jgi:hypothetical protein
VFCESMVVYMDEIIVRLFTIENGNERRKIWHVQYTGIFHFIYVDRLAG